MAQISGPKRPLSLSSLVGKELRAVKLYWNLGTLGPTFSRWTWLFSWLKAWVIYILWVWGRYKLFMWCDNITFSILIWLWSALYRQLLFPFRTEQSEHNTKRSRTWPTISRSLCPASPSLPRLPAAAVLWQAPSPRFPARFRVPPAPPYVRSGS